MVNLSEEAGAGLSGLEQLRRLMQAGLKRGIAQSLDFALVEIEEGRAVFEAVPGLHALNVIGTIHGGYAATILDSACGCAVQSKLAPGQSYTTLELKIAYHKALTLETGPIRVVGTLLSMGRRVGFAEAKLTDAADKLYASATSTLLVISP